MVQAALAAIAPVLSGFSGQSRKATDKPELTSAVPYIASAPNTKAAKAAAREADKERILHFFEQPEVLGILMTIGGVYASQKINFTDNELANEGLQATVASACVLIGLGHAGVGDMTTAIIAGLAGLASVSDAWNIDPGQSLKDDWYKYLFPFGGLWSVLD